MTRRLLIALLLSLLVHLWMVGGLKGWLPAEDSQDTSPLRVELLPPPPQKPAAKPQPEKIRPAPPRRVAKPKPVVHEKLAEKPAAPPTELPPAAPPREPSEVPPVAVTPVPQPAEEPKPETAQIQAPSQVESPQAETSPVVTSPVETSSPPAEEPAPQVPGRVEIDFQIVRKGGVAGVEHQRYQAGEDGHYVLTSRAEAKGLLALVLSDLVQRSEGQVTAQGLKPESYLYQYGNNPDKAQKATFDWPNQSLVMQVGERRQMVELPEGTQDLLSFMYQFMFVPPLQEMQLTVTNGKKLKVYNYSFFGEETLETKMGPLRTLHIGKSNSDGEEKTEIWLAADYHYLPVKISKTEKDGTVTERIATHLQTE